MTVGQLIAKLAIQDQDLPVTSLGSYRSYPIVIRDVGTQEGTYSLDAYSEPISGPYVMLFKESH